ncbi:MAG: acyl-CoA desaturase [Planctomycetes bacterium]|nr:acyl-CoA desaturase [Planctomycetota bacterium]
MSRLPDEGPLAASDAQPSRLTALLRSWFAGGTDRPYGEDGAGDERIEWLRITPFLLLHAACLLVPWVGWSPVAVWTAVALYLVRMFGITAGYHRYFSHRAFRTSRAGQFALAVLANASAQRGPLWWAAHHRRHHRDSDSPADPHSPGRRGLFWSHVGWFGTRGNFRTATELVPDLARHRELVLLDRYDGLVPVLLGALLYASGALLAAYAPDLGTSGAQMLVWGCLSTVVLYHATFTINSLAHRWGTRRWATPDDSRNNALLALLTLGEGWHNNHHHHPHSVRQGFRWWELDVTWLVLRGLAAFGLVWDLRPVPRALLRGRREGDDA